MSEDLGLGKIIEPDREVHRDAIHVAVIPMTATVLLLPGNRVNAQGLPIAPHVGIVDPFLPDVVQPGQRYWLWLFPGTVTGMRHHWQHPAFAEQTTAPVKTPAGQPAAPPPPAWRTPTVLGIVQQMRDTDDLTGAPVLADALEEADFADGEMLASLRKEPNENDYYEQRQHRESVRRALDFIEDDGSVAFSEKWLRRYAVEHNPYDVEGVFGDAKRPGGSEVAFQRLISGLRDGDLFFNGSDLHSLEQLDDADELRHHAEQYLGIRIDWSNFSFSCSC